MTAEIKHPNRIVWGICFLLAAATFLVYWPSLQNDFTNYDDPSYVVQNPSVQKGLGWETVKWAFTSGEQGVWQPVTWLSYALDYKLYGLKAAGFHLTSLLIHIANALLLFLVLRRMTGALWRCALVAALFAFHPLRVESVAWVAERKDVLSAFFGLLVLWSYARYVETSKVHPPSSHFGAAGDQKPKIFYLLSLLFFALGLMSKPMLVTFPFLLLLLDWWPLGRMPRFKFQAADSTAPDSRQTTFTRLLLEKLPFFLLVAGSTFLTTKVMHAISGDTSLPISQRASEASVSYLWYIGKTIWPSGLAVCYPPRSEWPVAWVLEAGAVLLVLSLWAFRTMRTSPSFFTGWFWFLGTLVPVSGIIYQGCPHISSDRYTYITTVGLFIMLAWGLERLCSRWPQTKLAVVSFVSLATMTLAGLTWHQLHFWKNSETLFRYTLTVTTNNSAAHEALGFTLKEQGRFEEAYQNFTAAARINPDSADAAMNRGLLLNELGRLDEAIDALQPAANHFANPYIQFNLANLLTKKGRLVEAEQRYRLATSLKPDFVDAHYNLALNLVARSESNAQEAGEHLKIVLKLKPDHLGALINLGAMAAREGNLETAAGYLKSIIKLQPEDGDSHFNLAMVLDGQGKAVEAIAEYRKAIQFKPGSPVALNNLAWILAANADKTLRNGTEAVQLAERACELTQQQQPAFIGTLAAAYAEAGRFDEAISTANRARELALKQGLKEVADRNAHLLELYQAGRAYHEEPKTAN